MWSADLWELLVECCGCFFALECEERLFAVRAVPDAADRVPVGSHLVPDSDTRNLYRSVACRLPHGAYGWCGDRCRVSDC